MFALIKPFWPVIWRGLAIVALFIGMWWSWVHFVKDPYIEQGVAQEHVETEKQTIRADTALKANTQLNQDLATIRLEVKDAKARIDKLQADDAAAAAESKRLLAVAAVKEKNLRVEIDRLKAIAAGPPAPSKEQACEDANSLFDEFGAQRLRN